MKERPPDHEIWIRHFHRLKMLARERDPLRLPNLIGVGSGRAATSSLYQIFRAHPDVYVSPVKEVNYFAIHDEGRHPLTLDDYRLYFAGAADETIVAEISPGYFARRAAPARMRERVPDARILITIREPIARSISLFTHHAAQHGMTDIDLYFARGLEAYDADAEGHRDWFHPAKVLDQSLYDSPIARYRTAFGEDRVFIVVYEDFVAAPLPALRRLGGFLGLDLSAAHVPHANRSRTGAPAISEATRKALMRFFDPMLKRLEHILPETVGAWRGSDLWKDA